MVYLSGGAPPCHRVSRRAPGAHPCVARSTVGIEKKPGLPAREYLTRELGQPRALGWFAGRPARSRPPAREEKKDERVVADSAIPDSRFRTYKICYVSLGGLKTGQRNHNAFFLGPL